MIKLCVTVEKNGKPIKVGVIKGNNTDDARFSYLSEYLNTLDAAPLSISLPLSEDLFTAQQTKSYFEGLIFMVGYILGFCA